jgi:glucose/arabinose dehydrogenase
MKLTPFTPLLLLFLAATAGACAQNDPTDPPSPASYQLTEAFPQLSFNRPVDLQNAGDGSNRVFVIEQRGVISVFKNEMQTAEKTTFLDIESQVDDQGNEEGLLGLAFHPNYQSNGFFYLNYTASNPNRTVISRFRVSSDANKADVSSEQVLLEIPQPYSNHNGGQLAFGPDGYLYIAVGDGGSGGDPEGNGQNLKTLLGSILRIDVDKAEGTKNYGIPSDNPFANNSEGYAEEIYAFGLRNPWRFSFDSETGKLWTGDVGQNNYEEIDIIVKGGNYGWNIAEGNHCFRSANCDLGSLEPAVWEYERSQGVSVTGGFVYRGTQLRGLIGRYIYADFASGRVWSLDVSDPQSPVNLEIADANFNVSSFGIDEAGELFLCGFDGKIHKLVSE